MKGLLMVGLLLTGLVIVQFAQAQTVDEVLDKHIAARGGKDKLVAIKSMYMEGSRQMMGNEVTIRITKEQDKLSRTEFEMGAGNGFMLVTDKEAWTMFSMRSTTPTQLPAERVAEMQTELDIAGPMVDYAAKGHKAELAGKEAVNGADCFKIKITTKASKEITYWIDATTYMMVQSSQKGGGGMGGGRRNGGDAETVVAYTDYKAVDGVLFAHTIEVKASGPGGGSTTFDIVQLNKPVDAKLYKPE